MPNPKRRHSKTRTAKRRTHQSAALATLSTCSTTGEIHLRHRAYKVGDDLMYRGKVVSTKSTEE
ncbi:MAG: 50S ribosomal protein L32 [Flavobacteriales bacterium]